MKMTKPITTAVVVTALDRLNIHLEYFFILRGARIKAKNYHRIVDVEKSLKEFLLFFLSILISLPGFLMYPKDITKSAHSCTTYLFFVIYKK